ncbi:uncharacterized protein [Dysidea avara]|uniref:uncharacterized protein n=1 Tax=Dysidea avara TaxID=196820 RepID=UPI0033327E7B
MSFSVDFAHSQQLPDSLQWEGRSTSHSIKDGVGLLVQPADKTDFWRITYYDPPFVKHDGVTLTCKAPTSINTWSIETEFSLKAVHQFDQAGIIVKIDSERWMKTGIEYVDGIPRMSAVVTNHYSDWSTQSWGGDSSHVRVRVSKIRDSLVAEYYRNDQWVFMRIAHLDGVDSPDTTVSAGVYTCAPTKAGMTTIFHQMKFLDTVAFDHKN